MKSFARRVAAIGLLVSSFPLFAVTHEVAIGDNFFSPNDLTIQVGDTVRWTYNGSRQHDVTADDFSWSSPTSNSIDYSRTFNSIEEVLYHCTVHSSPGRNINTFQNGRINVIAAEENTAPTAGFSASCTDLGCSFTDTSTDSDGTIASWAWDFGDGNGSTMQNPEHGYADAGSYSVMLTVTDDDGAEDTTSQMVEVSEPAGDPVVINMAMSDAWAEQATTGQGFFIIAWENLQLIFLSWFTFDAERPPEDVTAIVGEPGHRWVTAIGPFSGDTATLDVFLSTGGVFDSPEPPVVTDQTPVGTMTITWHDCSTATLSYNLPNLGLSGDISLERVVPENTALCEQLQPQE
jgi:PKD repeat protein